MNQIASASVKCAVTEENKEILKRSLCKVLGLEYPLCNGDEIRFELRTFDVCCHILIIFDVLPDMKGYSFWAQLEKVEKLKLKAFFYACITLLLPIGGLAYITHSPIILGISMFVWATIADCIDGWYRAYRVKSFLSQTFDFALKGVE